MAATAQETSEVSVNDGSENQEKDRLEDMSLERKDSLKAKTLKKHGHLRVKEDGQTTYKRTSSNAIMAAIQLGIGYSVGRLSAKQERDILMQDFSYVEKVWFPGAGSRETPSHRFIDFKFKSYAPSAFRYFRDLFGMQPSDFLMALSNEELRELSNPGASGSLFFLSADDNFIIKTVQHKEATFLQQLLPGYYMNLHQNPRTLLPKFFGLYCYQSQNVNIRLVVMNNILPTTFKCHQIYDLKGSTFKRKASKAELAKKTPTKKDLDFRNDYNEGITMDAETYDAVMKTIRRDCRVLESFKIMDYSLLLGIHNMDQALRESENASKTSKEVQEEENPERVARRAEFGAALEAIQIDKVEGRPLGGIPAKSPKGDRLILFLGIIDILQSYRLVKKLEHGWKALVHDADSVSVHNPSFYAKRFIDFMGHKCFRRGPPGSTRGSAKRRSVTRPMPGGGSASATSGRQRANQSGSFSSNTTESTTPKAKEGKTKSVSVKFSEPVIIDDEPGDQMIPPPYQSQKSTDSNEATFKEEESTSETVPSDTVTARSGIEEKTEEQRPIENTEIKVEIVDAATNEVKEDTGNTMAEPKGSHIDESATSISTNETPHSPATDNHPETATLATNDIGHQLVVEESNDDIAKNDVSITSDNSVFVIGVKEPSVVSNSVTIVTKTSTATYKTVETVREGDANVIVSQTTREVTEVDGGDQKAKVTEITEVIKGHSSTDVLEDSHNDDNTVKELNNIPNHVIKVQSQASGQRLVAAQVASQKSADIQVTDIDVDMKGTVDLPDVVLEGTPDIDKNDNLPNSDVMVTVL